MSDTQQASGLPSDTLTKQRDESATELVKALLIINGGGAVALLAFLQATWSSAPDLAKPTLLGIAVLSFGALSAASFHFFRHQTSWFFQRRDTSRWAKYRCLYLWSASLALIAFALGICIFGIGIWNKLPKPVVF
jgi:hypothetical protein